MAAQQRIFKLGRPEVAQGHCCLCNAAIADTDNVTGVKDARSDETVELHEVCAKRLLEAVRDELSLALSKRRGRRPGALQGRTVAARVVGAWRKLYHNILRVLTDSGRLTEAQVSVGASADALPRFQLANVLDEDAHR